MSAIDPTPAADAPAPQDSLRDLLRGSREALQATRTIDLPVPGWGALVARYHVLSWRETRQITARHERVRDVAQQELYIAADSLIAACDGTFASLDGQLQPLNMIYGIDLARYLGEDGAESARQAVFQLIPNEIQLITHYGELMAWMQGENVSVDEDLAQGN